MSNLKSLAIKHNSDKYGSHFYTEIYERYMYPKKNKHIKILEIGVGGYVNGNYSDTHLGGESLRMWRDYFKKGSIVGLDIFEKKIIIRDHKEDLYLLILSLIFILPVYFNNYSGLNIIISVLSSLSNSGLSLLKCP